MYHDICDTVDVCQEGIDLKLFLKTFFLVKTGQRIVSEHSGR